MSGYYKIVKDEEKLKDFIKWLPDLMDNEVFYVCLLVRRKYSPELINNTKGSQNIIKRFTSRKENLFEKIKQLEVENGLYYHKGYPVPEEGLALYIHPNPRNVELATKNSLIKFAHLVTQKYNGYNPYSIVLSEIQNSIGNKMYIDFDFDGENLENAMNNIKDIINIDAVSVVLTRGGFHCLVNLSKIDNAKYKKTWYNNMKAIAKCDVAGDMLLPVIGTTQGNYIPKFYMIDGMICK